jgi:hypothetical protein
LENAFQYVVYHNCSFPFTNEKTYLLSKIKDVIFPTYQVALGIIDLKEWKNHSKQKQIEDQQKIEQLGKYFKNRSLHTLRQSKVPIKSPSSDN